MRCSRSAQEGVMDYNDDEIERRRSIIAGEGRWGLPSLYAYEADIVALRPLTGEENDLYKLTLAKVQVQDKQDRDALDRTVDLINDYFDSMKRRVDDRNDLSFGDYDEAFGY